LQTIISDAFQERAPDVLDAGCGERRPVEFPPDSRVTGIDISEEQLARNMSLDIKILGDLQSYPLPKNSFDLAICWDVLEHLNDPEAACRNMWSALRPNGLLVLGFPNSRSVKGMVTRFTPHWAHVQAYRRVFGMPEAGTGDHAPFPTKFRPFMAPEGIRVFAEEEEADTVAFMFRESTMQRWLIEKRPVLGPAFERSAVLVEKATRGRISARDTDCVVVLRKPPSH
jgi:SAM-dependent methyltransferase